MTEPARSPGGEPAQSHPGPPGAGPPDGDRWARRDEGPSAPPEATPVGYAPPPPAAQPWGTPPSSAGWGPAARPPAPGPGWGAPPVGPAPVPPPRETPLPPKRVEPVPGTPFGVVHLEVPPVTSGLAVGSLVTGIVSILVSLLVICFGVARNTGGVWAAGAFTVLAVLAGAGAIVAGLLGLRQIRRPAPPPAVRFTGRGLAWAGISCGATGLLLSLLGLGLAVLLSVT